MAKINTLNYQTVASWNGSQDLFVVEQPDGTKVATPAMVKQFIEAGDFEATGEVKDGHGNILGDVAEEIGDLSQTGLTGDSVAEQLTTAGGRIAGITDGMDVKTVRVTWPSSGTMLDRATNIVTQILTNTSFSKQFNIVNILENDAASSRLGQFLYSAVSSGNYGEGIFFSYYTDNVCKVKNANGTITVKQLSEVS